MHLPAMTAVVLLFELFIVVLLSSSVAIVVVYAVARGDFFLALHARLLRALAVVRMEAATLARGTALAVRTRVATGLA